MDNDRLALKVGATILVCVVVFSAVLIRVGRLSEWLKDRRRVEVVFQDAKGIPKGAAVFYQGVQIGAVEELKLRKAELPVGISGQAKTEGGRDWVMLVLDVEDGEDLPLSYEDEVVIRVPLAMGDPDVRITPAVAGAPYKGDGPPIVGSGGADIVSAMNRAMSRIETTLGALTGEEQVQQLRETLSRAHGLLGEARVAMGKLNTELPATTGKIDQLLGEASSSIKDIHTEMNGVLKKTGSAVDAMNGTVNSLGLKLEGTIARADRLIETSDATVKTLETETTALTAKAQDTVDELHGMLKENRPAVKAGVSGISQTTAEVREATRKAAAAVEQLRDVLAENRDNLRRAVSELEATGSNLKSASADIRQHPWKLLRKPSRREVVSTDLAVAGDQAAAATAELGKSISRLEALVQSEDKLVTHQLNAIEDAAAALKGTLEQLDNLQKTIEKAK